jgi:hypothetical protein
MLMQSISSFPPTSRPAFATMVATAAAYRISNIFRKPGRVYAFPAVSTESGLQLPKRRNVENAKTNK